jgi:succinate dehydrogenase/fumarate reductase cytochrome b subunit
MVQLIPPLFGLLFWLLVLLAFNHVVAGVRLVLMGFIVVRTCSFLSLYWQRPAAVAVVPAEPLTGSQ